MPSRASPPQPGQRIMRERPDSEHRSWMWQPPLPGGGNQFPGGSFNPPKSSAFSTAHCYVNRLLNSRSCQLSPDYS